MPAVTSVQVDQLTNAFFQRLLDEVAYPAWSDPETAQLGKAEQLDISYEHEREMTHTLDAHTPDPEASASIRTFAAQFGIDLGGAAGPLRDKAYILATRAFRERDRFQQCVLMADEGSYSPSPPFTFEKPAVTSAPLQSHLGPALSLATAKYLGERSGAWAERTKDDVQRSLEWLKQHVGADRPINLITKAEIASFREGLLRMQRSGSNKHFVTSQTDQKSLQVTAKAASKNLAWVKGFFRWAKAQAGLVEVDPTDGISIAAPKKKSAAALSVDPTYMQRFFETPLFQGHLNGKIHKHGPSVRRGEHYWYPVLLLFTGMRAGEAAQLQRKDILLDIPARVSLKDISVKTEAGQREIPLAEGLLKLGFLDWVASHPSPSSPLFPAFPAAAKSNFSDRASKLYSRYLERVGLKKSRVVLHWLRHSLEDALKNASAPDYVLDQIQGHKEKGMKSVYGKSKNLPACKEAIDKADFGFNPVAVLEKSKARWVK